MVLPIHVRFRARGHRHGAAYALSIGPYHRGADRRLEASRADGSNRPTNPRADHQSERIMRPIQKVTMPGSANEKVIALFKRWLERAEQGRLQWAGVIVSEHPTHNVVDYAGAAELTYAATWGMDILKDKVRLDLL